MTHAPAFMSLQHQPRHRHFPDMLRSRLQADMKQFTNLAKRQLGLFCQESEDLDPPMICEAFDDSLELAFGFGTLGAFSSHARMITQGRRYSNILQNDRMSSCPQPSQQSLAQLDMWTVAPRAAAALSAACDIVHAPPGQQMLFPHSAE